MGVDLQAIHRALALQIRNGVARDTNVYPFPQTDPTFPCVTVYPGDPWFDPWGTFGPNGESDILLRLKIDVDGDAESMAIKLCDYCSVGTGNDSSVSDAVMADKTLAGTVGNCVTGAVTSTPDTDPGVAWIEVRIILSKQNAEV